MDFASVFSALRRENGYSQRKVANDLNISQALLSHYENGIREPRLEFIVKACKYYGVTADYMLGINNVKHNPYTTGAGASAQGGADMDGAAKWESKSLRQMLNALALALNSAQSIGGDGASRLAEEYFAACVGRILTAMNEPVNPGTSALADRLSFEAAMALSESGLLRELAGGENEKQSIGPAETGEQIREYLLLLQQRAAALTDKR